MRHVHPKKRNPVAKALAQPALKSRVVPARNKREKRAKEKLRQSLRDFEHCRLYSANLHGQIG